MLRDSIYCSRVDVLIRMFVLSSIGHLDDRVRNIIFRLWRALGCTNLVAGLWTNFEIRSRLTWKTFTSHANG